MLMPCGAQHERKLRILKLVGIAYDLYLEITKG